jgi:hypothetical protein
MRTGSSPRVARAPGLASGPSRARAGPGRSARPGRTGERLAQRPQQGRAVASPGVTVHAGQERRPQPGEAFQELPAARRSAVRVELHAQGLARPEDVGGGDGRSLRGPGLREQVAAEKGPRRALVPALPAVGKVRGVEPGRSRPPVRSSSPSARARGGRSAISASEIRAPMRPHTGSARGAAASHWLREPHSSFSTCEKPIQRSRPTGRTAATASRTAPKSLRGPVWNSSGSSSSTRNWLKLNPPGIADGGTGVEMR